jgi:bifunctional non-homologous end joining protein LigD
VKDQVKTAVISSKSADNSPGVFASRANNAYLYSSEIRRNSLGKLKHMGLDRYLEKRRFERTPEPTGKVEASPAGNLYIIQKHDASHLHYDLRLELDGVLKSWAVPRGPSLNPADKRLAVHVEDHPIEYGTFEGIIPEAEYGGGTVMLWDRGTWEPEGDPREGYAKGDFKFKLHGVKLKGNWVLARMKGKAGGDGKNWLLIKKRDSEAISGSDPEPVETMNRSVASGWTMQEIASQRDKFWYEGEELLRGGVSDDISQPKSVRSKGGKEGAARVRIDPASLSGARPARQPGFINPELATLVSEPPQGENWVHEIKYDGYRILCVLSDGQAKLFSRNERQWTDRFPEIAEAAAQIPVESAILDGEIVVVDQQGRTDFQALQNILQGTRSGRLVYFVFDIAFCAGYDVTQTPLIERKKLLKSILREGLPILYTDHIQGQGEAVFDNACRLGLEGIISKRADSIYEQRRSRSWLKVKCFMRQEFVIGGYTDPGGSRAGFGALLLGYFDPGGGLVYSGKVGTGFSEKTLEALSERLRAMETGKPPFINPPAGYEAKGAHWTRPELVGEVEFSAWTEDGILRHPSFKGLREDKNPKDVVLEHAQEKTSSGDAEQSRTAANPKPPGGNKAITPEGSPSSVALSNPDRVLYPEIGITKRALAEYYADVADWIMPHLAKRPLTLVRCPEGLGKECFFQKHLGDAAPDALRSIPIMEKDGQVYYSVADNIDGVIALVQMGALEIHVWGSREDKLEQPDMMVFDLDPAPEVEWPGMLKAARLLRERLSELGLESFVKTTGGKGLHIVAPLTPEADWDTVKAFSRAVAESVVRETPAEYIATMSKEKRKGKIFIDYLRNGRGATSVAAYSTRSRQGAPISTPVAWDELTADLKPDSYNIQNIRHRLATLREDPWADYFTIRQQITSEMRKKVGL